MPVLRQTTGFVISLLTVAGRQGKDRERERFRHLRRDQGKERGEREREKKRERGGEREREREREREMYKRIFIIGINSVTVYLWYSVSLLAPKLCTYLIFQGWL